MGGSIWMKKSSVFLLGLLMAICAATQVNAGDMYAILVVDTEVADIGASTRVDLANMEREVRVISSHAKLPLHLRIFAGDRFNRDQLLDYLKGLEVGDDDVIFFYYAGHGFRIENMNTRWPAIFFDWSTGGLDLAEVADILEQKSPRMSFIMADCCNNLIPGIPDLDFTKQGMAAARSFFFPTTEDGYTKLFGEFSGMIITVAADVGDYSLGIDSTGGLYTQAFLKSLHREVKLPYPSWEYLLQEAVEEVVYYESAIFEIYPK